MSRDPTAPHERAGVIKSVEEVPTMFRLENYVSKYEGRDVWAEWVEAERSHIKPGGNNRRYLDTLERQFKAYMDEQGRHHALARPEDVEGYLRSTKASSDQYLYRAHFRHLDGFFKWLWRHANHPHAYAATILAAIEGGVTRQVWDFRQKKADEKYNRNHGLDDQ